jgi:hypothetical protein
MKYFNIILESPDEAVKRLDDIGGPHSHYELPVGLGPSRQYSLQAGTSRTPTKAASTFLW